MDKLPKVFANPINKELNNEQEYFRSGKNSSVNLSSYDIDNILNSNRFNYRTKAMINGKEETIIRRVGTYLLTINNKKIPINDIRSIEVI